jgi:uncharacterized protein (TIGR02145 family)
MKKRIVVVLFALALSANLRAQVTIGALAEPVAGALLDLNRGVTGGLLLSNVALPNLSVIPANTFVNISTQQDTNQELVGMIVYNTDATTGIGIYVWNGDDWIKPCAPPAPRPITLSGTTICGTTFTAKIDSVKGATSYEWTLPQGLTGTSSDTIITITGAVGTYDAGSITVRAVSSCGGGTRCKSALPVTVGDIPAAPANPRATKVSGNDFKFEADPVSGCVIDWYTTETGGSPVRSGDSFTETLTATKTYYVESRNSVTGCVSALPRSRVTGAVIRTVADCDATPSYGGVITPENVRFINEETHINEDTYNTHPITLSAPVKIVGRGAKIIPPSESISSVDYSDHSESTADYGSWFTWCMVATHADILCPSPWRVPSLTDFQNYSGTTGSTNSIYGRSAANVSEAVDGWLLGGFSSGNSISGVGLGGFAWSSTAHNSMLMRSYYVYVNKSHLDLQSASSYSYGFSLRCVK